MSPPASAKMRSNRALWRYIGGTRGRHVSITHADLLRSPIVRLDDGRMVTLMRARARPLGCHCPFDQSVDRDSLKEMRKELRDALRAKSDGGP